MKLKKNKPNDQSGFTLAEILVTVGIFAIVMMISSSIFININNLQQQTANMARLQNEGRYVLEKIGKEIRGRELDYDQTVLEPSGVTDVLAFKPDEYGEGYRIYYVSSSQEIMIETTSAEAAPKISSLTADDIIVEKMAFKVMPLDDPYSVGAGSSSSMQPRVTIMMQIKNRNVPERYLKTLLLQTTISSKIYR